MSSAPTPYRSISVTPTAGALGAEVAGVDLARALDAATFAELRHALNAHGVILLRDQAITPDEQLAFARRFGEIHLHPFVEGLPEAPEVMEILKTEADERNFGHGWHTDQMFSPRPAMATILYAKEIPPAGGDTLFASLMLAYERLSEGMQRLARRLRTVNIADAGRRRGPTGQLYGGIASMKVRDPGTAEREAEHPLVRTHPETGRQALYIGLHTQRFAGMTEAESEPLIEYLIAHATRPEHTYRLRWSAGALAVWDNRQVLHNAINDYPGERRRMHRVTIAGDVPA